MVLFFIVSLTCLIKIALMLFIFVQPLSGKFDKYSFQRWFCRVYGSNHIFFEKLFDCQGRGAIIFQDHIFAISKRYPKFVQVIVFLTDFSGTSDFDNPAFAQQSDLAA